jgi:drug/metabolite transporter (DMT)-like permease
VNVVPVLAALGCALFNAMASVIHHRAGARRGGFTVVLDPGWLLGTAVAAGAFVLHTVALRSGQLALVQPLLVSGLIFALPAAALFEGKRFKLVHLGWSATMVVGLALFLASAQPAVGRRVAETGSLAIAVGVVLLFAAGCFGYGVRRRRHRAALWALAGGSGYAVVAALLKQDVGLLDLGPRQVVTSWTFYALLLVGGASVAVNQAAFNAGPLVSSLPTLTIANPVVAIAVGALVFGEGIASAPTLVAGQVIGFAVMAVSVVALTASALQPHDSRV